MSAPIPLQSSVDDYLAERRRLGFALRSQDTFLADFARFVADRHHDGPLTVALMVDWVRRGQAGLGTPETWYRRMAKLRPATFETLFGLMATTGLRVSEAIHLQDADVDLKRGMLIVRESKFAKSRQLPLHPTTVDALARFRRRRRRDVPTTGDTPFFTGSRGRRLGKPLGERQVHRVFYQLRDRLNWVNRGAHTAPRLHDLRHHAVKRLMDWHREGTDLDQMMLALSTYLGHTKIAHTYWYLSAVPELMSLAGDKFERFVALRGADDE